MTSQIFFNNGNLNKSMLQILHQNALTVDIVFIRVTCKLFEFIGFFFWSRDFPNMVMTLKSSRNLQWNKHGHSSNPDTLKCQRYNGQKSSIATVLSGAHVVL